MAKIQIIQPDSGPSAGQAGLAKFSKETSSISVLDAYAGQGGKISSGFFLLQTRAPHLSKEKSQLLFFPRGRNRSSPTGRTEQEKELRLNLCLVNTTNPPSPGTTGVAGEGSLGSATSWKAGQEMKSPVSWCSYCTHRAATTNTAGKGRENE